MTPSVLSAMFRVRNGRLTMKRNMELIKRIMCIAERDASVENPIDIEVHYCFQIGLSG